MSELAAIDFFVVSTATFRLLYCFVVFSHDRRHVVHFNVTANPSAQWTVQQIIEALPFDQTPRYMIRDRDSIYGDRFRQRIKSLGIEDVVTAARLPWQYPYVERLIGSIRRECLDHVIVLGEAHLKRILAANFLYYHDLRCHLYHDSRCHLALDRNSPESRLVELPDRGAVISVPLVGGLHHRYTRRAA